jgi:hypothetical protein
MIAMGASSAAPVSSVTAGAAWCKRAAIAETAEIELRSFRFPLAELVGLS